MYTRLIGRRTPSLVITTENEWEISTDKAAVLLRADENGARLQVSRHAVHVYMNPALGNSFEIITPDDGLVTLRAPSKAKQELMADLEWHYKVFIVRIDLPNG